MNWYDFLALRSLGENDTEDTEQAKRLRRIFAHTLHMVSRGANRRPVILRKESDMHTDDMVNGNPVEGDGTGVTISKAANIPKQLAAAALKAMTEAAERLASVIAAIKGSTDAGEGMPKDLSTEIAAIGQMLSGFAQKYPSPGVRKSDPAAPPAQAPAPPAAPTVNLTPTLQVPQSPFGQIPAPTNPYDAIEWGVTELSKAGKAMSGANLETFRKGVGILSKLLESLSPEDRTAATNDEKAAALSKSLAPPAPPAPAVSAGNNNPSDAPPKPRSNDGWACGVNINETED